MSSFLPDETRLSQVHLRTSDLERALGFYTRALGLQIAARGGKNASLSATGEMPPMIVLSEKPGAAAPPRGATGLYHLALRYPNRSDLGRAVQRLWDHGQSLEGAANHHVSEAVYLSDPDGNGVELYADRPHAEWTWRHGEVDMGTERLNVVNLLESAARPAGAAEFRPEMELGHIHLRVADLAVSEQFYREFLGMSITQRSLRGALFFAAGSYHHHVAVNTWAVNRSAPSESAGLISFRLQVPEPEILYCLRNRAPLAGYSAKTDTADDGAQVLHLWDPDGHQLELLGCRHRAPASARKESATPNAFI